MRLKPPRLRNLILYGGILGLVLFVLLFIVTSIYIGRSVEKRCRMAQEKYEWALPRQPAGCTEALISYLEDESNSYRSRNSAVWALGQIGDSRAVPVLKSYYTGNIPNKEPLDAGISQYELKKAINLTTGGFNLSKLIWEKF